MKKEDKEEELGTKTILKCFHKIKEFYPEIEEYKKEIFINKKLYQKLKTEYYSIEVRQRYDKLKEISEKVNQNKDEYKLIQNPEALLGKYNGFSIKKGVIKTYNMLRHDKNVEELLFDFLIPHLSLFDYSGKQYSLGFAIQEYQLLNKYEIEAHFISFLLRESNFQKYQKTFNTKNHSIKLLYQGLPEIIKDVTRAYKNNFDEINYLKSQIHLKNYEEILIKKKIIN